MISTNGVNVPQNELIEVKSLAHLNELKKGVSNKCIALLFWADWHPPCHQLLDQMKEMVKVYKEIIFAWVSCFFSTYVYINQIE